jgi:polar amino acid transport system substrate-binding protein
MMRRLVTALLAAALIAVPLAGCGGSSDQALRVTLTALNAKPTPAPTPAPTPPTRPCGDLTASLHPDATLPAPGALPAGSFMARIRRRGRLIAGVDQNTLLFAYLNPSDGQLEGFEIDVLRQIARAIFGNPNAIEFKAITTAQRIPAIQSGAVDIVADAFTITCARRQQVDFTSVYYDAGQRVLVPSDSRARSIGDLGGKRVCATVGSTSIVNLTHVHPVPIAVAVPQRTDCLVALQQGTVDAISTDDAILLGFQAQDPYTKIVGPRFSDEPYGMAISQAHPDFVRFVNGVLAGMRADGTWSRIYAHWLGRFGPTPAPPPAHYAG